MGKWMVCGLTVIKYFIESECLQLLFKVVFCTFIPFSFCLTKKVGHLKGETLSKQV